MQPSEPAPVRVHVSPTPPVLVVLAAVVGAIGALPLGFFALVLLGFSGGAASLPGWLLVVGAAVLTVAALVGVALLVLGRSWLPLTLAGVGVTVYAVTVTYAVDADTSAAFLVALAAGPLLAAVLAALPPVRRWVRARRAVHAASR